MFSKKCSCGGEFAQIPDAPIMMSCPAQYYVECPVCKTRSTASKLSEIEELREIYKDVDLSKSTYYEVETITMINARAVEKLKI